MDKKTLIKLVIILYLMQYVFLLVRCYLSLDIAEKIYTLMYSVSV